MGYMNDLALSFTPFLEANQKKPVILQLTYLGFQDPQGQVDAYIRLLQANRRRNHRRRTWKIEDLPQSLFASTPERN
jgi:hypothetical protein